MYLKHYKKKYLFCGKMFPVSWKIKGGGKTRNEGERGKGSLVDGWRRGEIERGGGGLL